MKNHCFKKQGVTNAMWGLVGCLVLSLSATSALGASQIFLAGQILYKCTLAAIPDPYAAALPLTGTSATRIRIGSVVQDCNGRASYTLQVLSSNCLSAPVGAKVFDPVSTDSLHYSVEANNPTNVGSFDVVTGLLNTSCTGQVLRDVTNAIVHTESSLLFVNYTQSSTLSAGTYQDVLTITMTMK